MGTELLSAAAMMEVKRVTGKLWEESQNAAEGPGLVRRAATAAAQALRSAAGKTRAAGERSSARPAPAGVD